MWLRHRTPQPAHLRNALRRLTFAFLLPLLLVSSLSAQMKLLSPNTGWFVNAGRLLWTSDDGSHWKDITPSGQSIPRGAELGKVFFLDTSEGWATLSYPEPIAAPTPQALANQKTLYSIAHTENGGETWDASPLSYPPLLEAEQEAFAGPVSLYFLDSSHGWLDVGFAGLLTPGRLLATDDGGHTWNWVNGPPTSGRIFFHSVGDGWLISDQGGLQLYVTHDGAKTWQETRLKAPSELGSPTFSSFLEMPMFTDSQNGYLALHYYGPGYSSPMLVVYATDSAGRSWQPVKTLAVPAHARVALTDSVVILPVGTGPGAPSTEAVSLAGRSPQAKPASRESENSILGFSFVDRNNGWALKTEGLFDTDDGGATWKRITPPGGWPTRVLGMCRSPRQGCPIHAASFGAWVGWPTAPVFP